MLHSASDPPPSPLSPQGWREAVGKLASYLMVGVERDAEAVPYIELLETKVADAVDSEGKTGQEVAAVWRSREKLKQATALHAWPPAKWKPRKSASKRA